MNENSPGRRNTTSSLLKFNIATISEYDNILTGRATNAWALNTIVYKEIDEFMASHGGNMCHDTQVRTLRFWLISKFMFRRS